MMEILLNLMFTSSLKKLLSLIEKISLLEKKSRKKVITYKRFLKLLNRQEIKNLALLCLFMNIFIFD